MKKMKFDKDFLVRNRFWLLLGVDLPLWLTAFFILAMVVGPYRDEKEKDYKVLMEGLVKVGNNPKNEHWNKPLQEKENDLKAHKVQVWIKVWKTQDHMMTWPWNERSTPTLREFHLLTGPETDAAKVVRAKAQTTPIGHFGEEIPDGERREYAAPNGLYIKRMEELFQVPPGPTYYLGDWKTVFQPVEWKQVPPTVEECWLAQEEVWVKHELLNMVRATLAAVARFEDVRTFKAVESQAFDVKSPDRPTPDAVARHLLRNPNWELELIVELKTKAAIDEAEKKAAEPKEKPAEETKPVAAPPVPIKPEPGKPAEKEPLFLVLSPKSNLRNIHAGKLQLPLTGLTFNLEQRDEDGKPIDIPAVQLIIEGEPVDPGQAREIGRYVVLEGFDATAPQHKIEGFLVEDKSDPPLKGVVARQRLRNPSWELDLLLERNDKQQLVLSAKSKIRNVHPGRRTLSLYGVQFEINQKGDQAPVKLTIQGEPVAYGLGENDGTELKLPVGLPGFNDKEPLGATQVLDWYSSPIKRIDGIKLAYHSHRTTMSGGTDALLKPKNFGGAEQPPPGVTPPAAGKPGFPPPVGLPRPGVVAGGEGEGQPADATKTPNGLERNRYLDVNDQVRRLPLGMVLVVDQAHIQDVLTAFSNSPLRMQPTQVQYQHIRGVGPPVAEPASTEDPKKPGFKPPTFPPFKSPITPGKPPPGDGPRFPLPGGEDEGRPGIGGRPGDPAPVGFDDDPNLVQLTIYGIASLYERHPSRAAVLAAAQASQPGTPAPGTPPAPGTAPR